MQIVGAGGDREENMDKLGKFLELIQRGEFNKARATLLVGRARQRMSSSLTRPRRSARELIARRAPTVATSNPS